MHIWQPEPTEMLRMLGSSRALALGGVASAISMKPALTQHLVLAIYLHNTLRVGREYCAAPLRSEEIMQSQINDRKGGLAHG